MTPAEADRLLEAIENEADALIATVARSPSAAVQAQHVGMTALRDHLLRALDFRGFAADEPRADAADLRALIGRQCREACPASRAEPPGQSFACGACLLRPFSLDPLLRQTSRVGEPDPHA